MDAGCGLARILALADLIELASNALTDRKSESIRRTNERKRNEGMRMKVRMNQTKQRNMERNMRCLVSGGCGLTGVKVMIDRLISPGAICLGLNGIGNGWMYVYGILLYLFLLRL